MSKPSKHHILEESAPRVGNSRHDADTGRSFFTAEEIQAIQKCNIKIKNQGRYSEGSMLQAIAALKESSVIELLGEGEGVNSQHLYERYCVKKKKKGEFFDRAIYKVHGGSSNDYATSPSEETILLEIGMIRRSEKGVKSELFRKKETGGMVIFGPWWNYALMRLLELSSNKNASKESLGNYTAIKIIRSLFAMVKDDLNDIVKRPGDLDKLNSRFNVDWVKKIEDARRVIDHCEPLHLLVDELSAVEAHVDGLKSKSKQAPAAQAAKSTQSNAKAVRSPAGAPSKKAHAYPSLSTESASPSVGGKSIDGQGRRMSRSAEPRSRSDAPNSMNPPPELMFSANRKSPAGIQGNLSNQANDCWGRKRSGAYTANPNKTKGSWKFARRTLIGNAQVVSPRYEQEPIHHAGSSYNSPPAYQGLCSRGINGDNQGHASGGKYGSWGRKRDGASSANQIKTRGSWKFARRTLMPHAHDGGHLYPPAFSYNVS